MKPNHQKGSYEDFLKRDSIDITNKKFTFQLTKKNAAPTMINAAGYAQIFPASYVIPNIAIINEKDKDGRWVQKTIRYIPGESTIYKELQSNDKDVPKKTYKIQFVRGRKMVIGIDQYLLEFLMKCNQNATNPNRKTDVIPKFELLDTSISVSKEIAKDKLISEVTSWCWNGDLQEVKAYARVLNVDVDQSNDEVRHDLKVIAMRDPEKFLKDLKNPAMRKKHYVLEALDRSFLVLDPASNSIAWANNRNAPIAVAAIGTSPVDVLVNKLSTEDGALMYDTIVQMMAPDPVVTTTMHVPSAAEIAEMKQAKVIVKEPAPLVTESDSELMDITNQAIDLNIVLLSGTMWYKYKGESFKKKEGFVEGLKKNPEMLKSLRYEIRTAKATVE